jgi:signal transduction histidine kinase
MDMSTNTEENIFYKDNSFYAYFSVPTADKYLMKVEYSYNSYYHRIEKLEYKIYKKLFFYSILAALVSFLFSIYTLFPLHQALRLNEEFVKDILHDFNTPISSMVINLKIMKREIGESIKIKRLENNIQSILSLQENLQIFLKNIPTQSETFSLRALVLERIEFFKTTYPDITHREDISSVILKTHKDAFIRIIDNLLSNACKYNIKEGTVDIVYTDTILSIVDSGKGIKNSKKIFQRYYKEQERGIGLGLHIVKKLCDEQNITIKVSSVEGKGTSISLDLKHINEI